MERVPLVDEVVVDRRRLHRRHRRGRRAGRAPACYAVDRRCSPTCRPGLGQGQRAVEVALRVPTGDLVCWLDADVRNFRAALRDPAASSRCSPIPTIGFVKGYYRRPLLRRARPAAGASPSSWPGRCCPRCSRSSPASCSRSRGEYAGRRDAARDGAVRRGLGRRDRAAHRPRRARSASTRSRRSTSASASTATARSTSSRPQAMAILLTALRRAGVAVDELVADARALRRRPASRSRRGRDPRAPADDHDPRLPRQVRPRAHRVTSSPTSRHSRPRARGGRLRARPPRRGSRRGRTPRPPATRGR